MKIYLKKVKEYANDPCNSSHGWCHFRGEIVCNALPKHPELKKLCHIEKVMFKRVYPAGQITIGHETIDIFENDTSLKIQKRVNKAMAIQNLEIICTVNIPGEKS